MQPPYLCLVLLYISCSGVQSVSVGMPGFNISVFTAIVCYMKVLYRLSGNGGLHSSQRLGRQSLASTGRKEQKQDHRKIKKISSKRLSSWFISCPHQAETIASAKTKKRKQEIALINTYLHRQLAGVLRRVLGLPLRAGLWPPVGGTNILNLEQGRSWIVQEWEKK